MSLYIIIKISFKRRCCIRGGLGGGGIENKIYVSSHSFRFKVILLKYKNQKAVRIKYDNLNKMTIIIVINVCYKVPFIPIIY